MSACALPAPNGGECLGMLMMEWEPEPPYDAVAPSVLSEATARRGGPQDSLRGEQGK